MAITQHARLTTSTHTQYIRGFEDATTRNRILLFGLRSRGKIKLNQSGTSVTWKVKCKRRDITAYDDLDPINYERQDLWTTANLGWGAYNMSDAISKSEKLANRDPEAIFQVYQNMMESLMSDFEDGFNAQLYSGSGSGSNFVGLLNALRFNAASNTVENLVAKAVNYAGISLDSSSPAGSVSGFWSPSGKNTGYNSTTWTTANKPIQQVAGLIRTLQLGSGKADIRARPDVCILTGAQYDLFKHDVQIKGAVYITPGSTKLKAVEYGFDATPFNGVDITYDDGIPSTDIDSQTLHGVVLNFDYIDLLSQQATLFSGRAHENIPRKSDLFDVDVFGQLVVRQPRYQGALLTD